MLSCSGRRLFREYKLGYDNPPDIARLDTAGNSLCIIIGKLALCFCLCPDSFRKNLNGPVNIILFEQIRQFVLVTDCFQLSLKLCRSLDFPDKILYVFLMKTPFPPIGIIIFLNRRTDGL